MSVHPRSTLKIAGHPLHPMLVPLPIGFLVGAFLADLAYLFTGWASWAFFATWLIAAGLVTAVVAAIGGLIDFFGEPRIRKLRPAWLHLVGNVVVLGLSLVNLLVHQRDGAAAVLPEGVILSGAVAVLLVFTGWMGGEMVYRHKVAVLDEDDVQR